MKAPGAWLMRLRKSGGLGVTKRKRINAAVFRPWVAEEWEGISSADCAAAVQGKTIGMRKSDQQFNFFGVVGSLVLIVGAVSLWLWLAAGGTRHGLSTSEMLATRLIEQGGVGFQAQY